MKIHKKTREKIGRISTQIIEDFEWIKKYEKSDYDENLSITEKLDRQKRMWKNEEILTEITQRFTPDELSEQIEDENFQALNTAGDFGNTELER